MKAYRNPLLREKEKSTRLEMLTLTKGNVFKICVITQKGKKKKKKTQTLQMMIENCYKEQNGEKDHFG